MKKGRPRDRLSIFSSRIFRSLPITLDLLEHKITIKKCYRMLCSENNWHQSLKSDKITFRVNNTRIHWGGANWGRKNENQTFGLRAMPNDIMKILRPSKYYFWLKRCPKSTFLREDVVSKHRTFRIFNIRLRNFLTVHRWPKLQLWDDHLAK